MCKDDLGYKQLNFGYNAKMEVYANLSSHIPKLCAIGKRQDEYKSELEMVLAPCNQI